MARPTNAEVRHEHEQPLLVEEAGDSSDVYTVDDAWDATGLTLLHWGILLACAFAWMAYSLLAVMGPFLVPAVACEWGLSEAEQSLVSSLVMVGVMVGNFIWGTLTDFYGRRLGLFGPLVICAIFGALSAFANNFLVLCIFQTLLGIGTGGWGMAITYLTEFLPAKRRGTLISIVYWVWSFGATVRAAITWVTLPKYGWRIMVGVMSIPAVLVLFAAPFMPESPRFLVVKGKTKQAAKVIEAFANRAKVAMPNGKLTMAIEDQDHDIVAAQNQEVDNNRSIFTQFFSQFKAILGPSLWLTTVLVTALHMLGSLAAFSLTYLVTYNTNIAAPMCNDGKIDFADVIFEIAVIGPFADLPGSFISTLLIESVLGRKWTMSLGAITTAIAFSLLFVQSTTFFTIAIFFGRFAVKILLNAIFVFTPEVYPTEVRFFAMGLSAAFDGIGGIIAPIIAISVVGSYGLPVATTVLIALMFLGGLSAALLPKETRGEHLADALAN